MQEVLTATVRAEPSAKAHVIDLLYTLTPEHDLTRALDLERAGKADEALGFMEDARRRKPAGQGQGGGEAQQPASGDTAD